jgi:alkylation response protein AidB-like acyl-CoA dehydrogenase
MSLTTTSEREALRDTVRKFLAQRSPGSEVRRQMDTELGFDLSSWDETSSQLGLPSIPVPEQYGGAGSSFIELAVVFEQLGYALACLPLFSSSVLATHAILGSGDEAAMARYLPDLAGGRLRATVALGQPNRHVDQRQLGTTATPSGDAWILEGAERFVLDGSPEGLHRIPVMSTDRTRRLAHLRLTGTPATRIAVDGDANELLSHLFDLAAVGLAAEQVGGAQWCLDTAVDYARTRKQFGRAIGGFQAIKHRCTDMMILVEGARSAAAYAAEAAADNSDELPVVASLAKAYCSDAFVQVALDNIQIHGGIGFTWEHDAHLYLRRAKSSQLLFGDPVHHRDVLLDRLGVAS